MKKKNKIGIWTVGGILILVGCVLVVVQKIKHHIIINPRIREIKEYIKSEKKVEVTPTVIITQSPVASTGPKVMSFEEMNKNFGPCTRVYALMYHHIQEEDEAKKKGQTNLSVSPEFFEKHLQYLKDKNYNVIGITDLNNFFESGVKLPTKPVLLTFDDGYKDNYEKMYPILKNFGNKATVFVATGLLENQGYLTWNDMNQMKDLVYFGNHTWSHHSSSGSEEKQSEEIGTADKQLSEHGFNDFKVFAYPYGKASGNAEEVLIKGNYNLAFTTSHGSILCKGKKFELPRIRVGNAPLSFYGL